MKPHSSECVLHGVNSGDLEPAWNRACRTTGMCMDRTAWICPGQFPELLQSLRPYLASCEGNLFDKITV